MISPDQVTALAPDAASFKAGKALAVATKWADLGATAEMVWGLAKGSGSKPYYTQVALDDFASKCSCPSHKFPCKHALGLLFLAAQDVTLFTVAELPDWVLEWKDSRQQRAEVTLNKKRSAKPKNEVTANRSKTKRIARVDEGVRFLDEFLLDLIRQGLAQSSVSDPDFWDNAARRLIDCQAPGLARYIRRMSELVDSGSDWQSRLLHEMGALYLLLQSYKQRDALSAELCTEVEQRIGWQIDKETVLGGKRVEDDWFMAFRTVTKADHLKVFSSWLYGQRNQQWALLLSFSAAGSAPVVLWPVGSSVTTELAFYPGATDERALVVNDAAPVKKNHEFDAKPETIEQLLQRASNSLAANPWQLRHPCLLNVQPAVANGEPVLLDDQGHAIAWQRNPQDRLVLETICGGAPTLMAAEWNGRHCVVHAVRDGGGWFQLRNQL